ncbi:MAG: hypothetical protein GY786_10265 [Proteobacteria bacterium]|nr:hypothetical protein [Pseudomonadota bacterium]
MSRTQKLISFMIGTLVAEASIQKFIWCLYLAFGKKIIEKDLIRKISGSFGFIPHHFREGGFIKYLELSKIALYAPSVI